MAQAVKAPKSNAKRSTSAKERGPKAADHKGQQGHALAVLVIKQAEKAAEFLMAETRSRKMILSDLLNFRDNAEHIAFRKDLTDKLEEIKKQADAAKISLNAYCDANAGAASVRVECSLWNKLSTAVERGWKPDMDKPWAEISKAATNHMTGQTNSTGSTGGKGTNAGPKQRAGRKAKSTVAKAQEFAASVLKDPVTKAPLPKDNRNLAQVVATLIVDASMEELLEVAAVVERQIQYAKAAQDKALAATKAASDKAKELHDVATSAAPKGSKRKPGVAGASKADALIAEGKAIAKAERGVRATPAGRPLAKQ